MENIRGLILVLFIAKASSKECEITMKDFHTVHQKYLGSLKEFENSLKVTTDNTIKKREFGFVISLPWKDDPRVPGGFVAAKTAKDISGLKSIVDEANLLGELKKSKLKHLPRYFGCFMKDEELYLLTEMMSNSLEINNQEFIKNNPSGQYPDSLTTDYKEFINKPPLKRLNIYRQMALGLDELHKNNFCHNDLKPANIMLSKANNNRVRLIDFGISTKFGEISNKGSDLYLDMSKYRALKDKQLSESEIMNFLTNNNYKNDIWALGVLIFRFENSLQGFSFGKIFDGVDISQTFSNLQGLIIQEKWMNSNGINLCHNKGLEDSVCFVDVIRKMMKLHRRDRKITAQEIAEDFKKIIESHNPNIIEQYEPENPLMEQEEEMIEKLYSKMNRTNGQKVLDFFANLFKKDEKLNII